VISKLGLGAEKAGNTKSSFDNKAHATRLVCYY